MITPEGMDTARLNQTLNPLAFKRDKSVPLMRPKMNTSHRQRNVQLKTSLGALAKHRQSKPKFVDNDLPDSYIKVSRHISDQYGSFIDRMRDLRSKDSKKLSAINMSKLRKRSNLKMGFGQRFKKGS